LLEILKGNFTSHATQVYNLIEMWSIIHAFPLRYRRQNSLLQLQEYREEFGGKTAAVKSDRPTAGLYDF